MHSCKGYLEWVSAELGVYGYVRCLQCIYDYYTAYIIRFQRNITILELRYYTPCNVQKTFQLRRFFLIGSKPYIIMYHNITVLTVFLYTMYIFKPYLQSTVNRSNSAVFVVAVTYLSNYGSLCSPLYVRWLNKFCI